MGVRVHDKAAEATVELAPDEAAQRWLAGEVALADERVRVRKGDRTGAVSSRDLASAMAEGWSLSDDAEAEQLTIRREESDAASLALGLGERALAGATLGASSLVAEALGADPRRMRARAEATGGFGEAVELAGAIVPGLVSGGAGTAASAARGSRSLAGTLGRAVTAPARAVSRAGAGVEAALAGRTGSTLVPMAGRGFVEGVGFDLGSQIDESVLGERELVAEQMLADSLLAGLVGAGAGFALPGIAKVGAGAARAPIRGMRRVLGRSRGVPEAEAAVANAANSDDLLEQVLRTQARATGADEDAAGRLVAAMREDGGLVDDVLRNPEKVTQEVATEVQRAWGLVGENADEVMGGALAMREDALRRMIPREIDDVAPRASADLVERLRFDVESMRLYNRDAPGTYLPRELDQLDDAFAAARHELAEGVDAAHAMVTLGKLRRRVGEQIEATGGFGKRAMGVSDAAWATNQEARAIYRKLREDLRDAGKWGDAAAGHWSAIDDTIAGFHNARREFAEVHRGGFGGSLGGGGGPSADQAIKLVRSYGRFGGEAKRNALEDLLDKRVAQLRTIRDNFDTSPEVRAKIDAAERGVADVRQALAKNAKRAAIADDYANLRNAETDRSPTSSIFSTVGPAMLGSIGGAVAGPIGGAVGLVAGAVTRPATTMKWVSRLRVLGAIDERAAGVGERVAGLVRRVGERMGSAASAGSRRSAGAAGTSIASASREERQRRADIARERAARISTDPAELERQIRYALYDVDEHAPGVATSIRASATAAAHYIAQHAPPVVQSPFTGRPAIRDVDADAKFLRRLDALSDPLGVLERGLDGGSLTAEEVDAVRTVYPRIYSGLRDELVGLAMESAGRGSPLPYRERIRLGLLFDLELDPSLSPQAIARTHEVHATAGGSAAQPTQQQTRQTAGRPGTLTASRQLTTHTQRITEGKA